MHIFTIALISSRRNQDLASGRHEISPLLVSKRFYSILFCSIAEVIDNKIALEDGPLASVRRMTFLLT